MSRIQRRALAAAALALVAGAGFVLAVGHSASGLGPRRGAQRPPLLLLTSLPLVLPEDFSLKGSGSPALAKLQTRYRVMPISITSASELARGRLLLMAQPQAQTAENLVALDDWVRRGGRVLLLADPLLEWPSTRPLGDVLRPPAVFPDTGLLAHWGLRLEPPRRRGSAIRSLAGFDVLTVSPGVLTGSCAIGRDGFVAQCRIGRGDVLVVADVDLLDVQELGPGASSNLNAIAAELASLEQS